MNGIALDELNPIVLEKLQARAKRHDRSLEEELKAIVEEAVRGETADPVALVSRIQSPSVLRSPPFGLSGVEAPSGLLQREGRDGVIEESVAQKPKDPLAGVMRIRQKLAGRKQTTDSGVLQREGRDG